MVKREQEAGCRLPGRRRVSLWRETGSLGGGAPLPSGLRSPDRKRSFRTPTPVLGCWPRAQAARARPRLPSGDTSAPNLLKCSREIGRKSPSPSSSGAFAPLSSESLPPGSSLTFPTGGGTSAEGGVGDNRHPRTGVFIRKRDGPAVPSLHVCCTSKMLSVPVVCFVRNCFKHKEPQETRQTRRSRGAHSHV